MPCPQKSSQNITSPHKLHNIHFCIIVSWGHQIENVLNRSRNNNLPCNLLAAQNLLNWNSSKLKHYEVKTGTVASCLASFNSHDSTQQPNSISILRYIELTTHLSIMETKIQKNEWTWRQISSKKKKNHKTNEDTTDQSCIANISHLLIFLRFNCHFVWRTLLTEKPLFMHPDHKCQILSELVSQPRPQELQRIESSFIFHGS
jgi:hypothetical protein